MCPTRCKVRNGALTTANYHQVPNEKTPLFPENTEEKAGFSGERLRWELNPRWRICNAISINKIVGISSKFRNITLRATQIHPVEVLPRVTISQGFSASISSSVPAFLSGPLDHTLGLSLSYV